MSAEPGAGNMQPGRSEVWSAQSAVSVQPAPELLEAQSQLELAVTDRERGERERWS